MKSAKVNKQIGILLLLGLIVRMKSAKFRK